MSEILRAAVDYALTHGLIKYNRAFQLVHAPLTLRPCRMPGATLAQIQSLTPIFNELMLKISLHREFLEEHLGPTAQSDDFVARLLALQQEVSLTQEFQLLINRQDYLFVESEGSWQPKQVELNTISVSFPFLATRINQLHRFLADDLLPPQPIVPTDPLSEVAATLAEGWKLYGHPQASLLMVVQPGEQNIFDQRGLEYELRERFGLQTLRYSLEEIAQRGRLSEGHLWVAGQQIAVAYFRAGYTPEDYPSPEAWEARRLIEASSAIKVPTLGMQLAGLKKIQQVLAVPAHLRLFLGVWEAAQVSKTFMGIYALDQIISPLGLTAAEAALRSPERYVLKPQREGGGNNLYAEEIPSRLQALLEANNQSYILMELIPALTQRSLLVVEQQAEELSTISEVGCYGVGLAQTHTWLTNRDGGYLVRTKSENQHEGGVCAGYACLDSLTVST